jgi:hypothetical protein
MVTRREEVELDADKCASTPYRAASGSIPQRQYDSPLLPLSSNVHIICWIMACSKGGLAAAQPTATSTSNHDPSALNAPSAASTLQKLGKHPDSLTASETAPQTRYMLKPTMSISLETSPRSIVNSVQKISSHHVTHGTQEVSVAKSRHWHRKFRCVSDTVRVSRVASAADTTHML